MIQGLMMTPPVIGRIAIGKVVERNGKRLPEKDDEFTITTQVQSRAGWVLHPMDAALRAQLGNGTASISSATAAMPANPADLQAQESEQLPENARSPAQPPAHPATQTSLQSKLAKRAKAQGASAQPLARQVPAPISATAAVTNAVKPIPAAPKLRSIPVRLLFNDPSLNLRAAYTLFDRATARPICVGDGESCKRVRQGVVESHPCPGPDHCALGMEGNCKLFGRFHVRIDHPANQSDACSTFVLRTTGINTVRTLMARMQYFHAISRGLLTYLPLELRLRGKSTAQSHRAPIYYVDLCIRQGLTLEAAVGKAREAAEHSRQMGLDQAALDTTARTGYAQGVFEESAEEAAGVLQEFYPTRDPARMTLTKREPAVVKKSKHEREHEPVPSRSVHLEQRYMDGLRFDGVWSHVARNSAGARRWKALPLPEAPSAWGRLGDPQGAWWCARQCAAVMGPSAVPPQSLVKTPMPHPEPAALAQALQAFLPDCSVQMRECSDTANQPIDIAANIDANVAADTAVDMAQVLHAGGCALLRLERLDRKVERNGSVPVVRWTWLVGLETWHQTRADRPLQGSIDSTGTDSSVHALLVVGPRWPAPWGGGFGAKVRPHADGSWRLASTDGEIMHCRVTACIAIQPAVPAVGD